ncbi:MAG TPA: hypothetical protein EYG73_01605 [Arcobacter sp.]|nr:hypothetical protein [Arcobacter sp.]
MLKKYLFLSFVVLFIGCASKTPVKTSSATVIFKTPSMKFYDQGFVNKYKDYIALNILNLGKSVLYLEIYENRVCQSTFRCIPSSEFNTKYLSATYKDDFLYKLFLRKNIYHKDKKEGIFIKVISDEI